MTKPLSLACLGFLVANIGLATIPSRPCGSGGDTSQCDAGDFQRPVASEQLLLQVSGHRSKQQEGETLVPSSNKEVRAPSDVMHADTEFELDIDEDIDNSLDNLSEEDALAAEAWEKKMIKLEAEKDGAEGDVNMNSVSESVCDVDVRRRRRQSDMHACRRRHSSGGHADTDSSADPWQCNEETNQMECNPSSGRIGWPKDGRSKGWGRWCKINTPNYNWNLKSCPGDGRLGVKVLTYNLFWWNLFNKHGGSHRSAGRLIARTSREEPYDFMAFQECDNRWWVLNDAKASGMEGEYGAIDGGKAIAIAYRKTSWDLLRHGTAIVGEDSPRQYYGLRSAAWARFRHKETGKTVFFMNHHGPLKVSEGGGCTGSTTALHLMKVIAEQAHVEDAIILTGDFNARKRSSRVRELEKRMTRVISGWGPPLFGIDHVFTNCGQGATGKILGKGDGFHKSDHDAIMAKLRI